MYFRPKPVFKVSENGTWQLADSDEEQQDREITGRRWFSYYCRRRPKLLENECFNRLMLFIVAVSVFATALWPGFQ